MNASLHPARTEPPAETSSTATSACALLNTKVGWALQVLSAVFVPGSVTEIPYPEQKYISHVKLTETNFSIDPDPLIFIQINS